MSSNGKRPRFEENSDEVEGNILGLVEKKATRLKLPGILESSIFGVLPTSDFTRVVGDFLFENIDDEYVEIEAKLGILKDNHTKQRIKMNVLCETIISPDLKHLKFETNMSAAQHKHFNCILNERVVKTKPPYPGAPVEYKHLYETDRIYENKIRVTTDSKTGEVVKGGVVEKVRIANLDIYSPNTQLDYRITVNSERPVEMPTGRIVHERNKDRLSYTHQLFKIDLTQVKGPEKARNFDGTMPPQDVSHELEVEFIDPQVLIEEKIKVKRNQPNRYVEIIE
ncbi:17884_t:CDS:2, partial [Acaulospora morrowiae]